jgi:hypothetical protein
MKITVEFDSHIPLYEKVKDAYTLVIKLSCIVQFKHYGDMISINAVDSPEKQVDYLKGMGYKMGSLGHE